MKADQLSPSPDRPSAYFHWGGRGHISTQQEKGGAVGPQHMCTKMISNGHFDYT